MSGAGSTRRPSSSSVTAPPRPLSSAARAARRSVSWCAEVADAGDRARPVGERREGHEVRHELAALGQVEVDAADAAAAVGAGHGARTVSRSASIGDAGAEAAEELGELRADLGGGARASP